MHYQLWDTLQVACAELRGAVTAQAALVAIGVAILLVDVADRAQRRQQLAVENFKVIMRYMGDLDTTPHHRRGDTSSVAQAGVSAGVSQATINMLQRESLRSKVLQLGLSHAATDQDLDGNQGYRMVDEIWCQLIKQTTSNPNPESNTCG